MCNILNFHTTYRKARYLLFCLQSTTLSEVEGYFIPANCIFDGRQIEILKNIILQHFLFCVKITAHRIILLYIKIRVDTSFSK